MCIFQSCVCICQNLHVVNSKEVKSIYLYIETREPLPRGAEEALNSLFNQAAPPYHAALNKADNINTRPKRYTSRRKTICTTHLFLKMLAQT